MVLDLRGQDAHFVPVARQVGVIDVATLHLVGTERRPPDVPIRELSEQQRELYEVAVQGDKALRDYLIQKLQAEAENVDGDVDLSESEEETPLKDETKVKRRKERGLRENTSRSYVEDSDDEGYFERLDDTQSQARKERERASQQLGLEWQRHVASE